MARPERNNVDYFPFYCKEGKAMFVIEQKYGNDGFATWVKILRALATTNFHYLDLSNPFDIEFLATKCNIDSFKLIEIINILVSAGEFDADLWVSKKVIWSDKFIESIQDAYKRRGNNCPNKDTLIQLLTGKCSTLSQQNEDNVCINTQSKVKYIKVNEIKVNETKEEKEISENFNFKMSLLQYGFKNELVDDWLKVRKTKKATNTQTAFKKFISEVEKINLVSINEILELCVERSWSGFKAEWYENSKPLTNGATFKKSKEHPLAGLKAASTTILEQYAGNNSRAGD